MNIQRKTEVTPTKGSTPSTSSEMPEGLIIKQEINKKYLNAVETQNLDEGKIKQNPNALKEFCEATHGLFKEQPQHEKDSIKKSIETYGADSPIIRKLQDQLKIVETSTGNERINAQFEYHKTVNDILSALYQPLGEINTELSRSPFFSNLLPLALFSLISGASASDSQRKEPDLAEMVVLGVFVVIMLSCLMGLAQAAKETEKKAAQKAAQDAQEAETLAALPPLERLERENEKLKAEIAQLKRDQELMGMCTVAATAAAVLGAKK